VLRVVQPSVHLPLAVEENTAGKPLSTEAHAESCIARRFHDEQILFALRKK